MKEYTLSTKYQTWPYICIYKFRSLITNLNPYWTYKWLFITGLALCNKRICITLLLAKENVMILIKRTFYTMYYSKTLIRCNRTWNQNHVSSHCQNQNNDYNMIFMFCTWSWIANFMGILWIEKLFSYVEFVFKATYLWYLWLSLLSIWK